MVTDNSLSDMGKRQRKRKVSFDATKMVNRKQRVSFVTKSGERVSFVKNVKVPKKVKVSFYTKKKK